MGFDLARTDTICALATASAPAAIAVVRVSGKAADDVRARVFRPRREAARSQPRAFMATLGDVIDATGGVIPYKNGMALAAYYCAVFSFIPLAGCLLGPVAIVLGVMGIVYANKHPKARGTGHAVVGILGGLVGPFFIAGVVFAFTKFGG